MKYSIPGMTMVFLTVGVYVGISGIPAQAAEQSVASVIASAVVYPGTGRVTRTARVSLKEGIQSLRLSGVQPGIDENSLSVSGKGTAAVKILGAGVRTDFIKESPDARLRELNKKLQEVNDRIDALNANGAVLEGSRAFLDSVRLFSGTQLPKDLVTKMPTPEELKSTLTFIETEARTYQDARLALNGKMRDFLEEKSVITSEINALSSGDQKEERVLTVDVECEKAGDLLLELAYNVEGVNWSPVYDARVDYDRGLTVLNAYAVASQQTGEDWLDVRLTLSTARPEVGGRMPELSSWLLRPAQVYPYKGRAVRSAKASNFAQYETALAGAVMSDDVAEPEQTATVSYAQAQTTGASLTYVSPRPVSVKSDGSESRVPLFAQDLKAIFDYAATPKLSPFVYLRAKVMNGSKDQLLPGRMNIFLDGTFVGVSNIDRTIAPDEFMLLYLGVDESVTAKRDLIEEKSDDTLIGNIPSLNRTIKYVYKFTVENKKSRPVTVRLYDHLPVAQDDKIRIGEIRLSLKPDMENYENKAGVMRWTLELKPGEKKEFTEAYQVEFPRDLQVEGL